MSSEPDLKVEEPQERREEGGQEQEGLDEQGMQGVQGEDFPVQEPTSEQPTSFGSPAPAAPAESEVSTTSDMTKQQLNFEGGKAQSEEPSTPPPVGAPFAREGGQEPVTPGSDDGAGSYNDFMFETITWKNKLRSVVYLIGGLLMIGLVYRVLSSSSTLVAGVCYIALAQMALNFTRQLLSPEFQQKHCKWSNSTWTQAAIDYYGNVLKAVAALNDKQLDGSDTTKTLRIGAGLWITSILGRYVSAFQLVVGLWILAFTLPKAYYTYQGLCVCVCVLCVCTSMQDIFKGQKPVVRAAVVVLPILVAGYVLSQIDLAVAVFLLLVYVRSWMQPQHVNLVKKNLNPITNTASKLGSRFGSFAIDQAKAYDVYPTPTPSKPKRN
ncbi:hypothetical protein DUNSADRAFT_13837 [Dunaliella salina]|uniref:Reticulon-like protein n=1 Tax=Dunaliella salina TaxID=3046 RepID=A0ABQ7G8N6_DUNSA|nr:hypothetical protein DUNSADRAFT_13837 [Dunaliella salina]|eukprot:KAF5830929.1 hypothetical protein DUNSADRAFT_13837 [Dunaliella salina]